jgi:hypothetical protein
VPIRVAWKYWPTHKGKVIGLILAGFSISSSFAVLLTKLIINPDNVTLESGSDDSFYPEEIANEVIFL